jgi:cytochrome c peroxidase
MRKMTRIPGGVALTLGVLATAGAYLPGGDHWRSEERAAIEDLWIGGLAPLAADPTNRVADDPRAIDLGQRLFFDTRLSSNGRVSCASCHDPQREFQDGIPVASGVGTTTRRTMPIASTAHAPFLFWDGRKDSQWAQAVGPLESAAEHGGSRARYAHVVAEHYRVDYTALFGPLPDLTRVPAVAGPVQDTHAREAWQAMDADDREQVTAVFVNIGKAIAAYERRIEYAPSRFDRYAAGLVRDGRAPEGVLTKDEVAGLRLFIGRGNCTQCHNGPLLTDGHFHNTGVPEARDLPRDVGRASGAPAVLEDEFNCRSRWSDATADACAELEYLKAAGPELVRAFKAPSLRNIAERAPYMHAGQISTLADVIAHYDRAAAAPAGVSEIRPLHLNGHEQGQLEAYLRSLSGGVTAPAELLRAPESSRRLPDQGSAAAGATWAVAATCMGAGEALNRTPSACSILETSVALKGLPK